MTDLAQKLEKALWEKYENSIAIWLGDIETWNGDDIATVCIEGNGALGPTTTHFEYHFATSQLVNQRNGDIEDITI